MKYEYIRKPACQVRPGDMIFSVKLRRPVAVDSVFIKSDRKLIIEDAQGNATVFGRKELVLVLRG